MRRKRNAAAKIVADWPVGVKFRVDGVMYTKVRNQLSFLDRFEVTTLKDGDLKDVILTIDASSRVTLVRMP